MGNAVVTQQKNTKYEWLISDVDGVLTTGGHYYNKKGKIFEYQKIYNETNDKKFIYKIISLK